MHEKINHNFNSLEKEDQKKVEELSKEGKEQNIGKKREEENEIKEHMVELIHCLSKGYIDSALEIKDKFSLSEETVQEAAKQEFIKRLSNGEIDDALEIKDKFSLPEEIVQKATKQGFINCLSNGYINDALEIKDKFSLSEEIVQQAAKQRFINCLSNGHINTALEIKYKFSLPEEVVQSPEVQEAAKQGFIKSLSNGYINFALEIKDKFSLSEEIVQSPEVQEAAKQGFIKSLSNDYIDSALEIKDKFSLPEEIVQEVAKQGFINCLSNGYITGALKIKDKFSLPEEIVQQAAKQGLINCLSNGYINLALKIKDKFSLPEEIVQSPEVQEAAKQRFINRLSHGSIDDALKIKDKFSLPEEIVQSPEVQEAAKQGFIKSLSNGYINTALKIKDKFSFSLQPKEIIEKIPEINGFLEKIKTVSPDFYEQTQKSTEVLIELFNFKDKQDQFFETIKESPFLLDAASENPRFGSKLLLKYPQLDELSQENIEFLFNSKKEILSHNPGVNPESFEFRQLMQEKLEAYKDNSEIAKAIKKQGIDIKEWLDYADTKYFQLESGASALAFSETISTPINRIKETIDSYSHTIKETLKEYRLELSNFKISLEDPKEIEDKISQMRMELEKAKIEGNEKKAQGIEKGIESFKKKAESVKTVDLWSKLSGDIAAFQQLKNDVFNSQEKLIQAENDFQKNLSEKSPSGKLIKESKEKINKFKEELKSKFGVLEKRIENFKTALPDLISPALGKDRVEALLQEINTNLAEQFDHYNADRSALANLFSERSDKEKAKLESQPMSVFVWARNPDIDLYQGNYSPCCICIDSAHMGAESTIADYNTDLGVQIVNIWDETKNEPITAAWCWLGQNEKGETALVVDNIESNTLYSFAYPEQLTKELFDYLKDYAQSIGAKKVVLGKANNDLPVGGELAKFKDDGGKYEKIGGSNRADGYFLEAEDETVKLIWEKEEGKKEKTKKIDKEAKETARIKFEGLKIEQMTEKDFAKLKQLERKIYQGDDLVSGQAMVEDILDKNGLEYSIMIEGKNDKEQEETIGYLVAIEDETDEGDKCFYLEDIAVLPEARGQKVGWKLFKNLIEKLKVKAKKENKPVLLDMHLREASQRFMEKYKEEIEKLGAKAIEEALVPDYYDEGEDALYKVYEIKGE